MAQPTPEKDWIKDRVTCCKCKTNEEGLNYVQVADEGKYDGSILCVYCVELLTGEFGNC